MRRHLWVLLAYLGLGLLLTWPMAAHFATHVPGDGIDDPALAWNLWWLKHALVDQPQNPFAASWVFWPIGINLAFYTLTILNGLLALPIQTVFGVVPAYNAQLLLSFVLGGYGAYLLCLETLGSGRGVLPGVGAGNGVSEEAARAANEPDTATGPDTTFPGGPGNPGSVKAAAAKTGPLAHTHHSSFLWLAAFLGGVLYAFAAPKLFYAALGQGNIASSQWIPFAVLYLARAARPGGLPRDAALAALFLVLQTYAEQTFASFLLIFALLMFAWGLLAGRRLAGVWKGLLARYALLAVLFALGIVPFLANMLPDLRAEGDFFSSGGGFAGVFSADLAGYLFPTQLHPLFGGLARQLAGAAGFPIDKGQQIYVGYVALALTILGFLRWQVPVERSGADGTRQTKKAGGAVILSDLTTQAWPAATASEGSLRDSRERPDVVTLGRARQRPHLLWPGRWFWAVAAGLFFLLTLGPTLRVAGQDLGLPLPFALVAQLPFFKGNRYPSRYSVMLLITLAPLVASGALALLGWIAVRGRGRALSGQPARSLGAPVRVTLVTALVFGGLLLFEQLSAPLPVADLRIPALYARVAQTPGDFAVLELPPGWRNGALVLGKQDTVIMQELWNQTAHGKRVLGGNTSRNPEFKFQYFAGDLTLARLLAPTTAADLPQQHTALAAWLAAHPVTDADRARARDWAAFLGLRYVMVHRDKLPAETEAALRDLLPVRRVADENGLTLYALDPDPAPDHYAPGTEAGRMVLGEGWSPPAAGGGAKAGAAPAVWAPPVWAQRQEVRLLLPLPPDATSLRLRAWSPMPGQRATLLVDGQVVGEQPVGQDPGWLTFSVPGSAGRPPLSDVRLRFAGVLPLSANLMSSDLTSDAPAVLSQTDPALSLSAALLVQSAGTDTGNFAHIYVDGRDLSPNRRGYNLVASVPQPGGRVTQSASFDTHLDAAASRHMADWIRALPEGTVVAGAVGDEGSLNLKPAAVEALRSLGVVSDLRGHFRWGHSFIGVKGALPGSALEAMDGLRPASVYWGLPLSEPQVAAAVTDIAIGR